MTGLFFTLVFFVAVGFGLRYLRAREIEKFREADMVDFQTFKQTQKQAQIEAPDALAARAEAFAALNPNVVTLKKPDDTDGDDELPANVPDPALFIRKPSAFDEVTRNLVFRLNQILPEQLVMIRDVPLSEFVRVQSNGSDSAYKLTVTKIDYLICDLPALDPVCGITLKDGQQGYDFIRGIFGDIGLPLLQFPATAGLSDVEIRDQLEPVFLARETRSCPKCSERMTIRRVTKGKKKGNVFWVCTQFPGCRGVIQA